MGTVVKRKTKGAEVIYTGIESYNKSPYQFRLRGEIGPKMLKEFASTNW